MSIAQPVSPASLPLLRTSARAIPDGTPLEQAHHLLRRYTDDRDAVVAAVPPHDRATLLARLSRLLAPVAMGTR
jgi:hypothetical protein